VKSVHAKEYRHTAEYISKEMDNVLTMYGANNFRACITDNASNMKSLWQILKVKYPWIYCYGCISHGLNLLAGDLEKMPFCCTQLYLHRDLVLFFRRHQVPKAILERCCKTKMGKILQPLMPVQTRWSSAYKMLKRDIVLKDCYRLAVKF